MNQSGDVIGFSVFELFEECYEYVENECFIAGSREQAEAYQREAGLSAADARIDQVRLSDLLEDFAVSGGGHAGWPGQIGRFAERQEASPFAYTLNSTPPRILTTDCEASGACSTRPGVAQYYP